MEPAADATPQNAAFDPESIIQELDEVWGYVPVGAFVEARAHREVMVPRLIRAIEDATKAALAGNVPRGNAHFFALFLLTEFRAREAWPAILAAMSLPDDLTGDLFEGVVTVTFPRTLVTLAPDPVDEIDRLVSNSDVDLFVRWSALNALDYLVRDDRLTRKEAIDRLTGYLRQAIDRKVDDLPAPLIYCLGALNGRDAMDLIEEAYCRGLVDESIAGRKFWKDLFAGGERGVEEYLADLSPSGIDDAVAELKDWDFGEGDDLEDDDGSDLEDDVEDDLGEEADPDTDDLGEFDDEYYADDDPDDDADDAVYGEDDEPEDITVRYAGPRVGRNDPCPCGSGKKFKKCCGSPTSQQNV
ncbi:MAG: DUF1186 domain-containing protein [Planctomycetia bacterium]|nr:DUF1186 domain-containing protein [Planctomycetia bacterium]